MSKMKRNDGFRIVGYYPAWAEDKAENIRYDVLTHIIYAFAIPRKDSTAFVDNPEFAKKLVKTAHENNTTISIALGGWSYEDIPLEPTFNAATETDEGVNKLADSIVKIVDEFGFDGVDMDWEHPRVQNGSGKKYERLMLNLSKKLHDKNLLLTCAVIGGVDANGNPGGIDTGGADVGDAALAQTKAVLDSIDWLNVMAYDGPGEHHASREYAFNSAGYWKNTRGMDGKKICLGVPFYGKPAWGSYAEIMAKNPQAWKYDKLVFDGVDACYNGEQTIKLKTVYAKENLGGIMMWEASQDTKDGCHSLLSAIKNAADNNN